MKKKRISHIKEHFNSESAIFDDRVLKIIPYYKEMLDAVAKSIPFPKNKKITIVDLGTGTGTVAKIVKLAFPNSHIKCVDLAPNMIGEAKKKLKGLKNIEYIISNFENYDFGPCDAVVSSLALHHIEPDERKFKFYKKVYSSLKKNGIFIIADVLLASNLFEQKIYLKKWEDFILKSLTKKQVLENYNRYKREDRPNKLLTELFWLKKAGFSDVDVYWKYYNFATYGGTKK